MSLLLWFFCVKVQTKESRHMFGVFGIRRDHIVSNVYEIHGSIEGWKSILSCVVWWCQVVVFVIIRRLGKRVTHCWIFCMKQWQAVVLPLCLTSLMYAGSIFLKCLLLLASWRQHSSSEALSLDSFKCSLQRFLDWLSVILSNILVWRNYVLVSTIIIILHVEAFAINRLLCVVFLLCL